MNRRELLQRAAILMGGAISAPAVLGVLNGCSARQSASTWKPLFLTEPQAAVVADVAELIIPRTDTPGARDVGVPEFIDRMLNDVYDKQAQERFVNGLEKFESDARSELGKPFKDATDAQRAAFLQKLHDDALRAEWADTLPDRASRRPFILMTKELTLLGFFTSEPGVTQIQQYVAVPGALRSCIPLSEAGNGRAWAPENTARF